MKHLLLGIFSFVMVFGLTASDLKTTKSNLQFKEHVSKQEPVELTGFENPLSSASIAQTGEEYADETTSAFQVPVGELIGNSTYDLQTNRGMCRRIAYNANGTFAHMGWTRGADYTTGAPNRGTGYNFMNLNTGVLQPVPNNRIEPMTRVGWPTIGFTSAGRTYSITHTGDAGMMFCWRDGNQSEWTETIVGNIVGDSEGVWARAASDGEKIFALISRQSAFGGVESGINVIRSLDNGETWDSTSGLDSDYSLVYGTMEPDSYQIDAADGKVAVVYGGIYSEINLYTSLDDAATWERTNLVTNSNPLGQYIDAELGFSVDPYFGTDGGNSVVLDSSGNPHVVYSAYWTYNVPDNDFISGGSFYPIFEAGGLFYWTEGMAAPEIIGRACLNDANADGTLGDILTETSWVDYNHYSNLIAHPSMGIDSEDNLYLAYASHVDGDFQPEMVEVETSYDGGATIVTATETIPANTNTYMDVFMLKKTAGGDWEGPLNVTDSDNTDDVYPSIARDINNGVAHVVYQSDPLAGNILQSGQTLGTLNEIGVATVDVADINDANAAPDSEPYIATFPLIEPFPIAQGCELMNDLAVQQYLVALDYPEGILPGSAYELTGDVDYGTPGEYLEIVSVTDSQGNVSDTVGITVMVMEDVEAPTMSVAVPCNDFAIIAGDTWTNPDVVISDDSFCDLNPLLQVQGNVDPNTVGDYTVVYNVSDYAGNEADPLTLNVSVIAADTEGPEITFVSVPDTLPIYGTVPNIDVLVLDNVDCENVTYTIEGDDMIETAIPGEYTITVTATDSSGNTSTATHIVVVTDNVAPNISLESNPVTTDCGDDGVFDENDLGEDFVEVDDNFTSSDDLVVEVDFTTVDCDNDGEYEVIYTVTDESGNTDDVTLTVIVEEEMTIGVEDYLVELVDIYPNPTQGIINVDVADLKVTEINIYNVVGELVYKSFVNNFATSTNIDLSDQPEGIYMVNVNTEEGMVTKKLTISK